MSQRYQNGSVIRLPVTLIVYLSVYICHWWYSDRLNHNSPSHFRSSEAREQPSSGLKQRLPDQATVYANKSIHCLYTRAFYTEKLYIRALLYIFRYMLSPILRRSSYRVQICGESTLGFEFERSQRFLFFLEFLFEQCIISWPNALSS